MIHPVRNDAALGFESQQLEFLTGFILKDSRIPGSKGESERALEKLFSRISMLTTRNEKLAVIGHLQAFVSFTCQETAFVKL